MTSRFYPGRTPTLHLFSEGGATQVQVQVFELEVIWRVQATATRAAHGTG